MKKLIFSLASLALLASCDNKNKDSVSSQNIKQATIDSIEYANRQQHVIDSLEAITRGTATPLEDDSRAMIPLSEGHKKAEPRRKVPALVHAPAPNAPQTTNNTPATQPQTSAPAATAAPADNATVAAAPAKKGLNNSAKGAIIGLGTGAAAGAIIGKENRGKGAIIGGVAGAIGGAVGGAILDKRKSKKAAEAARRDSIRQDSIRRAH